jgi:hypothetical protein
VSRPSDSSLIVLSSSIGGLEFLLSVVVCIEEYTRVRGYEEADAFNAGFGEDEVDGFAGVSAAPAGRGCRAGGRVCKLCRRRCGVPERGVCLWVGMYRVSFAESFLAHLVMSGVWVVGWIIWRGWGAGELIER